MHTPQLSMVKILYLYETLGVGGAEQLLLTTLKHLNRDKFYPVVYCLGENGKIGVEIEKIGVRIEALKKKLNLWNIGIIWYLIKIFEREKPDILHCHLFYANYFGRIAAIFYKVPIVIITEHGTYSNFKKFYHHLIDFILSFFTNKIIVVSKAVQRYLLKHSLILPNKISIIYNTVDFERFDKIYGIDKSLSKRRFGFSDSSILIGCIANIAPWKGHFFLLRAFESILHSLPQTNLCIVGRDNNGFQSQLETYAKENSFFEHVHFWGERRDIPEILSMFDLFVFPSLTEGFGLSVIEAMYMGLPVIATNTEGPSEIIENEFDGVLVSPGDYRALGEKITLLLRDNEKMKRMGFYAREKVKSIFSPRVYLEKLESCYDELIEKRI